MEFKFLIYFLLPLKGQPKIGVYVSRVKLPTILCPRCGDIMITRSTAKKTEKSKYFPNGKPLGEIRRYRYCKNCNYSLRTVHPLTEHGEGIGKIMKKGK